jgi:cysteine peptidase C11 family protein
MEHIKQNGNENAGQDRSRLAKLQNKEKVKWTVMVYLAGDNNLTANCITVLQQLEAVNYNKDIRVLACFDSNTPWPRGSRYLAVNGKWFANDDTVNWDIYNDLILAEDRGHGIQAPDFCNNVISSHENTPAAPSMTRTEVSKGLNRFIWWAKEQGPSDRYMLILYGHGPVVAGNTFLVREHPVSSLSMTDIPKVLEPHFGRDKRKLDILAFQNCAMNGIETAYEVKDHVEHMIGSQGLVLAYGWPYDKIIQALADNLDDSPPKISKKLLEACARHLIDFSVMDRSSEQSVCDLSKLDDAENLTDAITELSKELKGAIDFVPAPDQRNLQDKSQQVVRYPVICDAVRLARLEAQTFWGETFVDVYDFCERLLKKCNEAVLVQNDLINRLVTIQRGHGILEPCIRETDLRETCLVMKLKKIIECCTNVMDRVEEMVPYSYYIGPELQYSHGLSIYFPWSRPTEPYTFSKKGNEHVVVTAFETYSGYRFVQNSGWADFLKYFYRATLRKVRRSDRDFYMRGTGESLALGMVRESYREPAVVLTTEYLQKTESTGSGDDSEGWSNVKNYPRRNYLSPSDCPRRPNINQDAQKIHGTSFTTGVSYLGWNICEFVADVIRKKQVNGNNGCNETEESSREEAVSEQKKQEPERAGSR